ncbi:hypothetical protein DXG03_007458 [Asterophora parasitica]|uniref:RNA polymerase II-associated protein 3 n=1 Tax=Asterophora parasitica TaxID=117018 RepID=A0A9P7KAS8_9AGAR|nr:hypothetical protein DXG03_007458 [Asterophora parasitica]
MKALGNAAFKAGDYPNAVGQYTAAILADKTDFTYPLNRAAAYLKLGKNEDAERDCTTVLTLSALNAKALFRRGQARLGMGKYDDALTDLNHALEREPENAAVKAELSKVKDLLEKHKTKTSKAKSKELPPSLPAPPGPNRRRVPITIVDDAQSTPASNPPNTPAPPKSQSKPSPPVPSLAQTPGTNGQPKQGSTTETLKPVSTRSLKSPATATSPSPSAITSIPPTSTLPITTPAAAPTQSPAPAEPKPEPPRTFKDAKQARAAGKSSRVGGGIFRASGESTLFPTHTTPSPSSVSPSPSASASADTSSPEPTAPSAHKFVPIPPSKPPTTCFDFTRAWDAASGSTATAERWGLILSIPPASLPALFKTSLEPEQLASILTVFQDVVTIHSNTADTKTTVREYLDGFAKVERFGTVLLFLSRAEKAVARGVWETLEAGKEEAGRVWGKVWV